MVDLHPEQVGGRANQASQRDAGKLPAIILTVRWTPGFTLPTLAAILIFPHGLWLKL
jgi:hypothetical protein